MIPEREREALMRLTMCAREECRICMYQKRCDFDFQYELATKNMNILADALRADRKTEPQSVTYNPTSVNNIWEKPTNPYVPNEQTEPTISKMEQVEDEPQTCEECEHWNDTEDGCADRHGCKTEPKTDCA